MTTENIYTEEMEEKVKVDFKDMAYQTLDLKCVGSSNDEVYEELLI